MKVRDFVEVKGKQLTYYVRAFIAQQLEYSELDLFIWDTLEEWTLVTIDSNEPYSEQERVFWHLLHLINYFPESTLQRDTCLQEELKTCMEFLDGQGALPMDCIGIRP